MPAQSRLLTVRLQQQVADKIGTGPRGVMEMSMVASAVAALLSLLHGVAKPVVLHAHFIGAGVNPIDKA
jgi:uncharacterized membrane protein